jgi:hypothetical protein
MASENARVSFWYLWACCFALAILSLSPSRQARAFPLSGDQTVLPAGTELNEESLDRPREVFKSEAIGGRKSYLVNLGDLAFSSSAILGGVARQAGISCGTCHVNGASNGKLYIPRMSTRPGNFDTTGPLFNPKANDGVRNAIRIPSLRGARYLAPYGHDGRFTSLRDFVHNVIVNESLARSRPRRSSMPSYPTLTTSIFCPIRASGRAVVSRRERTKPKSGERRCS